MVSRQKVLKLHFEYSRFNISRSGNNQDALADVTTTPLLSW